MDNPTVTVRAKLAFPSLVDQIMYKGASTNKYGTQLANLSEAAIERLDSLGIEVKFKDDDYGRGQFIDCKSQFPLDNSGKFAMLFEADGRTPLEEDPRAIGYGSTVRAVVRAYTGRDGVTRPSIQKLVVEELVQPDVSVEDDEVL